MFYSIYKITNLVTNEVYIGKTTRNLQTRFNEHKNSMSILGGDIRYYKPHNFTIECLYKTTNLKRLSNKESYYIKESNSLMPNGYNQRLNKELPSFFETYLVYFVQKIFSLFKKEAKVAIKPTKLNDTKSTKIIEIQQHNKIGYLQKSGKYEQNLSVSNNKSSKLVYLGRFNTAEESQIAYDIAVVNFRKRVTTLNFPDKILIYKTLKIDKEKDVVPEIAKLVKRFYEINNSLTNFETFSPKFPIANNSNKIAFLKR